MPSLLEWAVLASRSRHQVDHPLQAAYWDLASGDQWRWTVECWGWSVEVEASMEGSGFRALGLLRGPGVGFPSEQFQELVLMGSAEEERRPPQAAALGFRSPPHDAVSRPHH